MSVNISTARQQMIDRAMNECGLTNGRDRLKFVGWLVENMNQSEINGMSVSDTKEVVRLWMKTNGR